MIEFKHVTKRYENQVALDDLNLTIPTGDFFVLVGPSGSGKTTTLKMINRLIEPTSGEIWLNDQQLTSYDKQKMRLKMGYVLQNIALFPNLNIQENIAIQPESLGWPKKERLDRARELLNQVGLDPDKYATRMPSELSGGEQQRVGIVRALATKPYVVLMDEPFSALDPLSRKQLQDLVLKLHQELQMTFVFVTHDMPEALRLGQTIAVMRNGHIQQVGTGTDIVQHPANDFVRGFFQNQKAPRAVTIQALLTAGFGTLTADAAAGTLRATDSLGALAHDLQTHAAVVVTSAQGPQTVTTADLLGYLATKEAELG